MSEKSWRDRLFGGLKRTSEKLGENLTGLFGKAALDDQTLDEIEEALIVSDLGPNMAARIRDLVRERIATRKPAAYLLKRMYMRGLSFYVDERVIVPRSYLGELLHTGLDGVIDEEQFPIATRLRHRRCDFTRHGQDVVGFVEDRDDD